MNDTDIEEMMGQFNVDDVLNDPTLNAELMELAGEQGVSFQQSTIPAKPPKPPKSATEMIQKENAVATAGSISLEDIETIGIVDESQMELTDADMNDPDLLSQLAILQNGGALGSPQQPSTATIKIASEETVISTVQHTLDPVRREKVEMSNMTALEAKQMALKFKKENNIEEAKKWLRYSKMLEADKAKGSSSTSSVPTKIAKRSTSQVSSSSSVSSISSISSGSSNAPKSSAPVKVKELAPAIAAKSDVYAPLEGALKQAIAQAHKEAVHYKGLGDTKTALEKLRSKKSYEQEMQVLESRRQAGASPTLFRWNVKRHEKEVQNLDIGEGQIRVTVNSAEGLDSVLAKHSGKKHSLSVSFHVQLPGQPKDDKPEKVPTSKCEDGQVVFDYDSILGGLKRGRNGPLEADKAAVLYGRKKAVFELLIHKGFLVKSTEVLGRAEVPMSDLFTKASAGGSVPLVTGTSRRVEQVGGTMEVFVRLRAPLVRPEVEVTEERVLIVDPWPTSPHLEASSDASDCSSDRLQEGRSHQATETRSASAPLSPAFDALSEREKTNPHAVDWLLSNDVLENEIAYTEQRMTLLRAGTEEGENDQLLLTIRLQTLSRKMNLLVDNVQSGELSLKDYLDILRDRVSRDQLLAKYLKSTAESLSAGDSSLDPQELETRKKEYQQDAVRVFKRFKIMSDEIKSAEWHQMGEEDEEG